MRHDRSRLPGVLCLLILVLTANVWPRTASAQNAFPQEVARLSHVMHAGDFEGVIAQATDIMNRAGVQDVALTYMRGMAEWHLCWFGAAYADLKPLGDFRIQDGWPPASETADVIERMKALVPANVEEVKEGERILFRVYYDEDTDWTKAIRKLLPRASKINSELFGVKIYETAVFIFKDAANYKKFSALRFKDPMGTWAWASGGTGILMFCRTDANGKVRAENTESDYFKGTVVHEDAHATFHRIVSGTIIPSWLDEGIAVYAASRIAPKDVEKNDTVMKRCFDENTLVALKDMSERATFYGIVEKEDAKRQVAPGSYSGTDAYQQAFQMVRYFLLNTKGADRGVFLQLYNESKDIDRAFQEAFHTGIEGFYAAWKTDAAKGLPSPKPE